MPLPAIIGPILSVLAWIGVDLGLSQIMGPDVEYVRGLDFQTFIGTYWPALLIHASLVAVGLLIAFPKNDGRVLRSKGR